MSRIDELTNKIKNKKIELNSIPMDNRGKLQYKNLENKIIDRSDMPDVDVNVPYEISINDTDLKEYETGEQYIEGTITIKASHFMHLASIACDVDKENKDKVKQIKKEIKELEKEVLKELGVRDIVEE